MSKLEPADAQKLRTPQDYAAKTREELYREFESLDGLRRELEKPRGHEEIGRNLQAGLTPDREQVLSMNRRSSGRDLQLANGRPVKHLAPPVIIATGLLAASSFGTGGRWPIRRSVACITGIDEPPNSGAVGYRDNST